MTEKPILRVTFEKPQSGYWNGGLKSGGDFTPELTTRILSDEYFKDKNKHPGSGNTIKWRSFYLNFWFNCGSGRTWIEAASIAKKRLQNIMGIPAKIEVIYPEIPKVDKNGIISANTLHKLNS